MPPLPTSTRTLSHSTSKNQPDFRPPGPGTSTTGPSNGAACSPRCWAPSSWFSSPPEPQWSTRAAPDRYPSTPGVVAPGLMVMAVIYFMGTVSGAHLNPAVTISFALRGDFPWWRVPGYVAAQMAGSVAAAGFLRGVFGNVGHLGVTEPGAGIDAGTTILIEVVLAVGLVSVILGTASGARNIGANAALAVAAYIVLAGLWAAPITGASMNPARSFGPALVGGRWTDWWAYIVGPIVGGAIAVGFAWILRGPPTKAAGVAAQGVENSRGSS